MFKHRVSNKTFNWPVKVKTPSEDSPGKFKTSTFTAEFLVQPRDRIEAAFAEDADKDTRSQLMIEALVDLHEIQLFDENDNEITDKAEKCEAAWSDIFLAGPIANAFIEGVTGFKGKN